ncbi:alpha/beta fold hydrolase [Nocardioides luti]|uniref:alpha/beta fold hydrolase n=1 Tax=Nocardioides luti TaxID=2761101 RepID=UPI001C891EDD
MTDAPAAAPLRHRTVVLPDGARLAVQESGPGDGPALLLLPGQANSHDWWTGLRDGFADRFRTITFDYRGTGATRAVEEPWSTDLFADDARRVLAACGVPRAHVYATSMGGRVAQVLAADHPAYVDRLVLACTSPGGAVGLERSQDVRRALGQRDRAARTRALLDLMYTPDWSGRGLRSHLLGDPTMTGRAQELHLRVSARHDAVDRLPSVAAPTLVLHGSDDLMSPVGNAALLAERLPDAEVEITDGGRHGFFDEHREPVGARVRSFLLG